jgi:hypothetical protein
MDAAEGIDGLLRILLELRGVEHQATRNLRGGGLLGGGRTRERCEHGGGEGERTDHGG